MYQILCLIAFASEITVYIDPYVSFLGSNPFQVKTYIFLFNPIFEHLQGVASMSFWS